MTQTLAQEKDFVIPVIDAIKALDSDERRRILIELEEAGSLSYSELKQKTGYKKGTLNYHLKELAAAGMIRNFLMDQEITSYTSYYEVSDLGRNIIEGILSAFRPSVREVQISETSTLNVTITFDATGTERTEVPDAASGKLAKTIGEILTGSTR